MPLRIRERPPKQFNIVKPRNEPTTERESMKKTAGTTRPETLQSVAKTARQQGKDLGGKSGWRPPSDPHHDHNPQIDQQMHKNYEDHFFQIRRGTNNMSVGPHKHHPKSINGKDYFR